MQKRDPGSWQWYASPDGEMFPYMAESKQQAVDAARNLYGGGWICQGRKDPLFLSESLDVQAILEQAWTHAEAHMAPESESPWAHTSTAQLDDLKAVLQAACDAWQWKHGLRPYADHFTEVRYLVEIGPLPAPIPTYDAFPRR